MMDSSSSDGAIATASSVGSNSVSSGNAEPNPEALCFSREGNVFQVGQVWSFSNGYNLIPRYYGRIQNITLSRGLELHVGQLRAKPYQREVIQWDDKRRPVGRGTFLVNKRCTIFPPSHLLHQIVCQTSMDGNECTILPKIGDVWAIYQIWDPSYKVRDLEDNVFDFEMVEILDDASDFKVLALESVYLCNEDGEKKEVFRAAEIRPSYACSDEDGPGVIFTIKKVENAPILALDSCFPSNQEAKRRVGRDF
ncbi:unnamed protein product [Microthlaspi erraticum]|uniref:DUF3444 domain-containing protein n=1 Tax=Microthlaspi erraticum TaxID=1685480 RepID=A0A6D2L852_9BRAS|nr:unnamed protein product [Microthlaspi erraticum]